MQYCWQSVLTRLLSGTATRSALSMHSSVVMFLVPLLAVMVFPSTETAAIRGRRRWYWVRCSAISAVILFATTVEKRGIQKQRVFNYTLN